MENTNKVEQEFTTNFLLPKVTRIEVIDHSENANPIGRVFTKRNLKEVELSYQDHGITLKIFIK